MKCTCNRNHVDDDEHAPTCASVLSAELAQLRADNAELRRKHGLLVAEVNGWRKGKIWRVQLKDPVGGALVVTMFEGDTKLPSATDAGGAMEVGG